VFQFPVNRLFFNFSIFSGDNHLLSSTDITSVLTIECLPQFEHSISILIVDQAAQIISILASTTQDSH
jgi:hypothetical protein